MGDGVGEAGPNVSNNPVKVRSVLHTGLQQGGHRAICVAHHVVHGVLPGVYILPKKLIVFHVRILKILISFHVFTQV